MLDAPLAGKRILLTRAIEQLPPLAEEVRRRGGIPLALPCLQVRMLPDQVRRVLPRIDAYSDVVFTSRNGVESVRRVAGNLARLLRGKRIAAVGRATAKALSEHGVHVDLIPVEPSQAGLIDAYRKAGLPRALLFFRASEGRDLLPKALHGEGVCVDIIPAYETVCPDDDASDVRQRLRRGEIDAVLLGSPKAARCYVRRIGDGALADRPVVAVISKQVATAARDAGLSVQVVANHASFIDMLDALEQYFRAHP